MVAPPDDDVLWARSLHHTHGGSPALSGLSVGVRAGEVLAVTGPRGSGKTTLLHCLSGRLRPDEGEVWFNSMPVHTMTALTRERLRRDRFGWLGPEPHLVPELNVWENAALPLLIAGAPHRTAKRAALEWLDRLDIAAHARRRPAALDRPRAQRVALARALVNEPAVVFADEPTAPLHRAEGALLLRTLTTAARSHDITVVLATHDPETTALADRTIALLDGRLAGSPAAPPAAGAGAAGPGSSGPGEAEGRTACSVSV
ncbi:ATP-binding cassette domain-containing protein [Streptomyces sp. NPDC089919]|uniref:ABC transporter ATP-binding protein n=1 Tax=Streptomyces sp. NPDC089919 TaxID=3155188 RepID=UPI00341B7CC6